MIVRLLGAAVTTAVLIVPGLQPATATAAGGDAAATSAYLRANYELLRVARSHLRVSEAAPRGILGQVRRDCPQAAANSPQNEQSERLSDELIGNMVIVAGKPDLSAIRSFIGAVSGLHWSNARLTSTIRSYAAKLKVMVGLSAPDLCGDIRAWAASGFTTLPSATVNFDRVFLANWVALGLQPKSLDRYEGSAERGIARRSAQIEAELTDGEARAVETWGNIMNELVLNT